MIRKSHYSFTAFPTEKNLDRLYLLGKCVLKACQVPERLSKKTQADIRDSGMLMVEGMKWFPIAAVCSTHSRKKEKAA